MSSLSPELLETLGDFTSKDNWDKFFTIRGSDDSFEWYADWPALHDPLLSQLSSSSTTSIAAESISSVAPPLQILVPGCGSSRLSEHLYDAGFQGITNVDFSKVVISAMLRRNIRSRPEMRWRVMDMTDMQGFADGFFDAVIDKGGLDALMEPKLGSKLGCKYLKEVKRVLKSGAKYLCLTLAESHVIGLLFSEFRFGWKTSVHAIPQKPKKRNSFQTFMVVIEKDNSCVLDHIISLFDHSSSDLSTDQGRPLLLAIERENETRSEISSGADILYSLEDLQGGAKGDLKELLPGRRCQLLLGEQGDSCFSYRAVLLDSQQQPDTFSYHCGAFIVPKTRAHEWLFSSEEGQWIIVESSKAARVIMVFLDSRHIHANMEVIQKDLSPLIRSLAPGSDVEAAIPFLMASDGVKLRNIVKKVTSAITGPIIVEDVIYENNENSAILNPIEPMIFRRLTFERSQGLVQSEALLIGEKHTQDNISGTEKNKSSLSPKSKKKGSQRRNNSHKSIDGIGSHLKVDHSYLASSYHNGILSGFMLISCSLGNAASSGRMVNTIIIGLGAGLFPMSLHQCLPFLDIEVVELDPTVSDLARDYFGFAEDKQLKVHIADGIKFIQGRTTVRSSEVANSTDYSQVHSGIGADSFGNERDISGVRILVIDADSSDSSSGLTCPPAEFLEESFLLSVKDFLSQGGLFVINLVSRSTAIRDMVVSRLKKVFRHLFYLELEEDVNDVLFALSSAAQIDIDKFPEMAALLQDLLASTRPEIRNSIIETAKKIRCLD